MTNPQIIPAILATTEAEYKEKLEKVEKSNLFDWVQIDLMDNKFVQNKSIDSGVIAKYPTQLNIEAQLMVEYPENWIDELVKTDVKRIVFPQEVASGTKERIQHIKNHAIEVGISINLQTPVEKLEPFVSMIDLILVMSVNPGFSGQPFQPQALDKVKRIKDLGWKVKVEVDGGINETVFAKLVRAGADYLVVGSHLLEGDISENLKKIQNAL